MKAHFRQWRSRNGRGGYFGAFAFDRKSDNSFAVNNFHDFDVAKQAAVFGCSEVSEAAAPDCVLYAVILPKEHANTVNSAFGLSGDAKQDFEKKYKAKQKQGRFGAFAISGAAEYGWAFDFAEESEARGRALAECQASVQNALAGLKNAGRNWAKSRSLDKCRIVDVSGR
ncbi:MAG: hypothetical protein AAGK92_07940 [Pseudomonadota bacterium]